MNEYRIEAYADAIRELFKRYRFLEDPDTRESLVTSAITRPATRFQSPRTYPDGSSVNHYSVTLTLSIPYSGVHMLDKRFGINGGTEPLVCGCGCGEPVRGRHANTFIIPNTTANYRILAKHLAGWTDEKQDALNQEYHSAQSPILVIPDPAPYEQKGKK